MGSLEFLFTVMKEAGVPKQTIHDTRKELIKIMEYAKPSQASKCYDINKRVTKKVCCMKKINKNVRLGLRLNESEYNILKAMYPKNISMAIRELIRKQV